MYLATAFRNFGIHGLNAPHGKSHHACITDLLFYAANLPSDIIRNILKDGKPCSLPQDH